MNKADDSMNALAFFIQLDNHDAIADSAAEFNSVLYWLANLTCLLQSFGIDVAEN